MNKALIIIDIQNDYMEGGKFPLWNTEHTVSKTLEAIDMATAQNIPIILVQHIEDGAPETSPLAKGTHGVKIDERILKQAKDATIVTKAFADSFYNTSLKNVLDELKVDELVLCGMMTQNCVTHTALSKSASPYKITVLQDATTTVNDAIHFIALRALSTSVNLVDTADAFK